VEREWLLDDQQGSRDGLDPFEVDPPVAAHREILMKFLNVVRNPMPRPKSLEVPIIRSVFHPTELSPAGESAFVHALKAALIAKAKFTILHVAGNQGVAQEMDWTDFPGVRTTLGRGCSRAKVLEGEC